MTRLLGLTPSIAQPPRERPLARAVPAGTARHHCQGSRVVLPLWGLSAYFLPQKLLYVVYCRKKTLNDRQSRRVNQQSRSWHGLPDCVPLCLTDGFRAYMTALLTHFGQWIQPPRRQDKGP